MKVCVRGFISVKEIVFPASCVLDEFEERHLRTQKLAKIFGTEYFKVKQIMVRNYDMSFCYAVVICFKISI
jgi:hypothetical protein